MPAFCSMCGRHVGHSGVRVTSAFYAGWYMCADVSVTAKQADGIRRVLESCIRLVVHQCGIAKNAVQCRTHNQCTAA